MKYLCTHVHMAYEAVLFRRGSGGIQAPNSKLLLLPKRKFQLLQGPQQSVNLPRVFEVGLQWLTAKSQLHFP